MREIDIFVNKRALLKRMRKILQRRNGMNNFMVTREVCNCVCVRFKICINYKKFFQ